MGDTERYPEEGPTVQMMAIPDGKMAEAKRAVKAALGDDFDKKEGITGTGCHGTNKTPGDWYCTGSDALTVE